jgi:hypothetical protein
MYDPFSKSRSAGASDTNEALGIGKDEILCQDSLWNLNGMYVL